MTRVLLAGPAGADAIEVRINALFGEPCPWFRPVALRFGQKFAQTARQRQVAAWLRNELAAIWGFLPLDDGAKPTPRHWLAATSVIEPASREPRWTVPLIATPGALADWLWLEPAQLAWYADGANRNSRTGRGPLEHYRYRILPKATGEVRIVEMPKRRLKRIQREVLKNLLQRIPGHPAAQGFHPGCSIVTFAQPHVGQPMVLRMDLRNFFPSVRRARVQAFFRTAGYGEAVADLLGCLCTNGVGRGVLARLGPGELGSEARDLYRSPHLPQGAPTSPALANLCAFRFDARLLGLAHSLGFAYTRYADDLAFSGNRQLERCRAYLAGQVERIACEEGFTIHRGKTRLMPASQRQHLTGLVINAKPNIAREEYDRLKAILTNCLRHGPASQNRENHSQFAAHLQGRISFVRSVHHDRAQKLQSLFDRIVF